MVNEWLTPGAETAPNRLPGGAAARRWEAATPWPRCLQGAERRAQDNRRRRKNVSTRQEIFRLAATIP